MSDLRETLERIAAPPPSPGFHDDLSDRIQASQRTSARRWRTVALVTTVAAIAAASAAGVLAVGSASGGTTTFDRTLSCQVITQLDSADVYFSASVKGPPVIDNGGAFPQPGYVEASAEHTLIATATTLKKIFVSPGNTVNSGYFFNNAVCKTAPAIPLSRSALPSLGVFSHAGYTGRVESCLVAANSLATVRMRVVLSASGAPVAAQLAVRAGKHQRPLAFIDWTPTRFTMFASAACQQH